MFSVTAIVGGSEGEASTRSSDVAVYPSETKQHKCRYDQGEDRNDNHDLTHLK